MRNLKIKTGVKGAAKACPLSSVKGKDGKYVRKVRVGDKCVNPTSANQRASKESQTKKDKLEQNKNRGTVATNTAAEKERQAAKRRGAQIG
tara:strand:- start:494 stop:766 length:273 start_codon:yes stop_codon:yes gene_type:complete